MFKKERSLLLWQGCLRVMEDPRFEGSGRESIKKVYVGTKGPWSDSDIINYISDMVQKIEINSDWE